MITDKSFRFQIGIGVAPHASLDTEQVICCTRTMISLQGSDGEVIPVSEVHDFYGRKLSGSSSGSSTDFKEKKGVLGDCVSEMLQPTTSSTSPSSVVQVDSFPIFWISRKA